MLFLSEGSERALSKIERFPRTQDHFEAAREHVIYLHILYCEIHLLVILVNIFHICEDIIALKNDIMQA